jgi:hypothetical protein
VKILFFCANFLPALAGDVAQICNLLYRRIVFGWVPCATGLSGLATAGGWQIRDTAECNSGYFGCGCAALRPFVVENYWAMSR